MKPFIGELLAKKMSLHDTVFMNSKTSSTNTLSIVSENGPTSMAEDIALKTTNQIDTTLRLDARAATLRTKVRVSRGLAPSTFLKNFGIMDPSIFRGQKTLDLGGGF